MPVHFPYRTQTGNQHVIETLAKEANQSVEEVQALYDREFARLKSGARILDYLVVLTNKSVREILRWQKRLYDKNGPSDDLR